MSRPENERDFGAEAQKAAELHLEACYEALASEDDAEESELIESPASAPFCGCETCQVREILYAAWPFLRDCALAGVLEQG